MVCFDKQPDSVFMECGHGGLCYECSLDVWRTSNECYLCRNVGFWFYTLLLENNLSIVDRFELKVRPLFEGYLIHIDGSGLIYIYFLTI